MGRKRCFLGFFATLFLALFTINAFAAGYSCPLYKKYTSCNAGYYLDGKDVGNRCLPCADVWSGSTSDGGETVGAEKACYKTIKLNKNGGSGTLNGTSGSTLATQKCYYGVNCALPSALGLTQDAYTFTGGWGISASCTATTQSFAYTALSGAYYACKTRNTITATATDKSKVYDGTALTCDGVSVSVPSSGATIMYGTTSGTYNLKSAPTITNVADSKTIYYQVTADNYVPATGKFECLITPAAGSTVIEDNGTTVTQGSTAFPGEKTLTVTCAGGATISSLTSGTATVASASNSGNTVKLTSLKTGSSVITIKCPETDNYQASSATYTWTVNPGTIAATVSNPNKTYDGSALSCSGISNVNPTNATVTYAEKSGTECGTYSSTIPSRTNTGTTNVCYKIALANYSDKTGEFTCTVSSTTGSVVIKDGSTVVTNGSGSTTYPNNKTLMATCPGNEATPSVSSGTTSVATASISNGTITLKPVAAGTSVITVNCDASTNYAASSATYTLSVNRGTCSISVNPTSGTITYPTTTSTFTVDKGSCNGNLSVKSSSDSVATATVSGTTGTVTYRSAGEATITVTAAQSGQYAVATATYKVQTIPGTITATSSDDSKIYDGSALTCDGNITVTAPTSGYTITYGTKDGVYDLDSAPTITNVADSKTIYYKITANNYAAKTGSFECTVAAADNTLTLSPSGGTMAYNANSTFTVTQNVSGGTLSVKSSNESVATASLSGTTVTLTSGANYGSSTITVSSAATANYKAASATYILVANKGIITLNNQSADSAGTAKIYQIHNDNVYLTTWGQDAMTTSANAITKPTKTGHTFAGYYDSTNYGTQYIGANGNITETGLSAGKALQSDGTWYAKWNANQYTVTYACGDDATGTPPANGTPTYNQNFTPAANTGCVRDGYTFNGWNDGTTNRAAGTAFTWTYTSNKTFTAQWKLNGATDIIYNENGGIINDYGNAVACNAESAAFALPTNVTRPGYTFQGWYNNSDLTGTAVKTVSAGACTGQLEYWADWDACNETTAGACNCASTQYPLNGICTSCSVSCSNVSGYTNGNYNVCNAQTDSACYRECVVSDITGATAVSGTVTKGGDSTCVATTCGDEYYKSGNGCAKCPENAQECGGGDASWECDTGYEKTTNGAGCKPKTYIVTLDDQGATTTGTTSVTATYNQPMPAITVPNKTDYVFGGYCTEKEGAGDCYYNNSGTSALNWNIDANKTLYAHWIVDFFDCEAGKAADGTTCSEGSFCPGGKVSASQKNLCEQACPPATGKTVTSPAGATASTQCTASGAVNITAEDTIKYPDATGTGTETCAWNGETYAASCNTVPETCIGGFWRQTDNSPFCNPVGYGYYRGGSIGIRTRNACTDLNGANSTVTTSTETSSAATACYNVCSEVKTADGNGVRTPENATENFNGTTIPACSYTTQCIDGYEPSGDVCVAKTIKVTLNHNGGTSGVGAIYLKYGVAWLDANGDTITTIEIPKKTGETFGGYLSGNTQVVNNAGAIVASTMLFSTPTTITASWSDNPTKVCKAGTYYPGTGAECATCPAGSYCEGVSAVQETGEAGRKKCVDLNVNYTAATDANGDTLTVSIGSATGSDSADDCYATNIVYTPNLYTAGGQTCMYDATTKSYSADCTDSVVYTCAGGYVLASDDAVACTPVGYGYYSPDKALSATQCPLNTETNTRGTTQNTTTASAEGCVMDNLWFENDTSGQRRQCFWSDTSQAYDRQCQQSTVVSCIAGYWYDASLFASDSTAEKYCVPVGAGAWSPAQSACNGEDAQPTSAGCSTVKHTCPGANPQTKIDDATGEQKTTASSMSDCVLACEDPGLYCDNNEAVECEAGSYCTGGVKYSCADGYTSDAGSSEESECYKSCTFRCNSTQAITANRWNEMCSIKYNANYCSRSATRVNGVQFYNTNTCVLHPKAEIPLACLIRVYCDMDYFYTPVKNLESGKCVPCSTIGGGYNDSISGALYSPDSDTGNKACYAVVDLPCTAPICPLSSSGTCDYAGYSEDEPTTYMRYAGYLFYGESDPVPGPDWATDFVCPATGDNGSYFECLTGYDKNESADIDPTDGSASDPSELCTPHVYTITLDANYDDGVDNIIYQKYKDGWYSDQAADATDKITTAPVHTRDNYTLQGYYTAPAFGGNMVIDETGEFIVADAINAKYTADQTFYAIWSQNVYECQAGKYYEANADGSDSVLKDCVAPYYCPGVGNVAVGSTGCRSECPTPQVTPIKTPATIAGGQSSATSCYANFATNPLTGAELANGDGTWICQYSGTSNQGEYANCNIIVNACNAGYYNQSGTVTCTTPDSGYYSPAGDLIQTKCPPKQNTNYTIGTDVLRDSKDDCYVVCKSDIPTVEHSTSVDVTAGEAFSKMFWSETDNAYPACNYTVECETGYEAVSGVDPKCKAKSYDITLNLNGGSGDIADTVRCTFDGGNCALPATSVLKRDGYNTANKWCANANGTGACYTAGTIVNDNISANGTNTVLYAIWEPAVFKITLSAPDAETNAEQGPVYLKYATGWFSDAAATEAITSIGTNLPGRGTSYMFAGYKLNDQPIIDANGTLSGSSNALTATTKDATATAWWTLGSTYCEPGYYYSGNGSECKVCLTNHWCPGGKFGTTENGEVAGLNQCELNGLSTGGTSATNVGVCYKEGMAYTTYIDADKTYPRATGTWTCNFETIGYTNCHEDTVDITWCAGGHWYDEAQSAIDCVAVGADNWSEEAELEKHACPDGGNTNGATMSDSLTDCQKRVETYVSDTNNAKGTHVCSARSDGASVIYDQKCQADTIEITWCAGGYWYDESQTDTDCVLVGIGHYSPESDKALYDCPAGGTTTINDAATPHGVCQKTKVYPGIEYTGPAVYGTGVHGCLYDQAADGMMFGDERSDGYVSCGQITMTECNPGYWWKNGDTVCKEVGYNNFGPVADANNSGHPTGLGTCPDGGLTQGTKSVDATACYLEKLACDITNGTGEQTRFYDSAVVSDTAGYNVCRANGQVAECDMMCAITGCDTGFSLVEGMCINCPVDNVCTTEEGQRSCAVATNGTHVKADAGTTDVAYCYAECALGTNAYQMGGRDYYGMNVPDTCEITVCVAGYTLSNGVCVECPAGMICNPASGDDAPKSCETLTGGEYTESELNSDSINDCYKVCEPYTVVNGTAVPVSDRAYYPADCEFAGKSLSGNPCEIVDGVCIESSCNYNFEMDNGICKPCAREHAISYKPNGNCIVESCASGYHPNGQQCESNVVECSAPNAISATQTWDASRNAFGACMITECADGYHLGANACQVDEQVCELEHGVGVREWNHKTNTWGECIATKCEPGYTNEPGQTNELWKQCGRCNNMYSANGDLAASSYVQGCEIAACMYQGELYTLENNECRLICDTYSDETGSRRWDASRKKCERTCEPGYTSW